MAGSASLSPISPRHHLLPVSSYMRQPNKSACISTAKVKRKRAVRSFLKSVSMISQRRNDHHKGGSAHFKWRGREISILNFSVIFPDAPLIQVFRSRVVERGEGESGGRPWIAVSRRHFLWVLKESAARDGEAKKL